MVLQDTLVKSSYWGALLFDIAPISLEALAEDHVQYISETIQPHDGTQSGHSRNQHCLCIGIGYKPNK